jgi:phospholipid/cholesterol/gamma-HCH transport system substrate-binding protein
MENRAFAFAAGLFTILLGAGVFLAAMWFTGDTRHKVRYVLESHYPVTGLNEQAVVRYRGVAIGKVTTIEFDRPDPRIILIGIAIDGSLNLTRGTYAELRSQGVTGLSYIQLDDDGSNRAALPPVGQEGSARILIRESPFANLADVAQEVLDDARETAKRMNALLSNENQAQLSAVLKNMELATRQIRQLADALQPVARSSVALVKDARATFARADQLLGEISSTNRELARRLEAIDRVAASAEKAGESITSLAESASVETLPRINQLAEELTRASRSLERLAGDLKQQPQSLVFGRRAGTPGPGEPGFDAGNAGAAR